MKSLFNNRYVPVDLEVTNVRYNASSTEANKIKLISSENLKEIKDGLVISFVSPINNTGSVTIKIDNITTEYSLKNQLGNTLKANEIKVNMALTAILKGDSFLIDSTVYESGRGLTNVDNKFDIVSSTDGIIVNENDIYLNIVNDLITGGITRPLSAEQGKVLYQLIQTLSPGGAKSMLVNARAMSETDYLGTLIANGLDIQVGKPLNNPVLYLDGTRIDKNMYTLDKSLGSFRLKSIYAPYEVTWVVEDRFDNHIRFSYPTLNLLKADTGMKSIIEIGDVIEIQGESDADDGDHRLVKCESQSGLNGVDIGEGRFLNEIPNTRTSKKLNRGTYNGTANELASEILGSEYGGVLNNGLQKVVGKTYYDTATKSVYLCTQSNTSNTADSRYYRNVGNKGLDIKIKELTYGLEAYYDFFNKQKKIKYYPKNEINEYYNITFSEERLEILVEIKKPGIYDISILAMFTHDASYENGNGRMLIVSNINAETNWEIIDFYLQPIESPKTGGGGDTGSFSKTGYLNTGKYYIKRYNGSASIESSGILQVNLFLRGEI